MKLSDAAWIIESGDYVVEGTVSDFYSTHSKIFLKESLAWAALADRKDEQARTHQRMGEESRSDAEVARATAAELRRAGR